MNAPDFSVLETPPENTRVVATRTGRATFRVSGSIAVGAEIWPGKMRYPIKFPKSFNGCAEWLKTRMNPAVYVAAEG